MYIYLYFFFFLKTDQKLITDNCCLPGAVMAQNARVLKGIGQQLLSLQIKSHQTNLKV